MHRWHFQRFVRTLVPLLLLLTLLCSFMVRQRAIGGGRSFVEDSAYLNRAVALNLLQEKTYGLTPDKNMPVTRDTLWRLIVAGLTFIVSDPVSASYLAGALCCIVTVMLMVRLARLLFPFPPFILYASILLILSAGFLLECISGTSMSLATMLMTGISLFHIEGLQGRRPVLPTSAVFMLGLAAWVRIEYLLLWPLLVLHAAIVAQSYRRAGDDAHEVVGSVLVRAFGGLLVLALFVLPLVAWNVMVIKVPWPRVVGAPLTFDIWGDGMGKAMAASWPFYRSALPDTYGELYLTPFLKGWFQRLIFWFGAVVLTGLSIWRREERPYTWSIFIPLLFPVLYALVYPYVGAEGVRVIFRSFAPVVVLVAVFGIFRIPFLLEGLYRRWKQGLPAAMGFNTWWIVVGSIFLLACTFRGHRLVNARMDRLSDTVAARAVLSTVVKEHGLDEELWLTDSPGLAAMLGAERLVDLTGETTVDVLLCLTPTGSIDRAAFDDLLADRKPVLALLSSERFEGALKGLRRERFAGASLAEGEYPRLIRLQWNDDS